MKYLSKEYKSEMLDHPSNRISTIVITRRRVSFLRRAIASIASQKSVKIDLIIIVDDCSQTYDFACRELREGGSVESVRCILARRSPAEQSGPSRLASLRNFALDKTETAWCSFLDDDNVFEPTHLKSLLTIASSGSHPAVHSWRSLWDRSGRRFTIESSHPWISDMVTAKEIFDKCTEAGIYYPGSSIVRDQVVPYCRDKSMVDMSEWLFQTDFLECIGFQESYDEEDWMISRCEDAKLLDTIVSLGIQVPCNNTPSLRYYMGGYSNNPDREAANPAGWHRAPN